MKSAFSPNLAAATVFVCPMHPEVISDAPGLCLKCNMKLDPTPRVSFVRPSAAPETWQWA